MSLRRMMQAISDYRNKNLHGIYQLTEDWGRIKKRFLKSAIFLLPHTLLLVNARKINYCSGQQVNRSYMTIFAYTIFMTCAVCFLLRNLCGASYMHIETVLKCHFCISFLFLIRLTVAKMRSAESYLKTTLIHFCSCYKL